MSTETNPTTHPKPWWQKWWVIAIAVVIVVGGIANALGAGADESETSGAGATPTATAEESTAVEPEPTEKSEPTETAEPVAPTEPTETAEPEPSETTVAEDDDFWELAPIGDGYVIKDYVDESAAAGDCAALQEAFNTWADADHVQDFAPNVLEYIDAALSEAGCY